MAAHQAPLSLGFSRQEHWSGLPFPSPIHENEKWKWSRSFVSDSLATPWTVAYQAPPSMGFSRQEYWSGVPLPSPMMIVFMCKYLKDMSYYIHKMNLRVYLRNVNGNYFQGLRQGMRGSLFSFCFFLCSLDFSVFSMCMYLLYFTYINMNLICYWYINFCYISHSLHSELIFWSFFWNFSLKLSWEFERGSMLPKMLGNGKESENIQLGRNQVTGLEWKCWSY